MIDLTKPLKVKPERGCSDLNWPAQYCGALPNGQHVMAWRSYDGEWRSHVVSYEDIERQYENVR